MNSLTQQIIGCILRVHRALGPGFVEKVYQRALNVELTIHGLSVEMEKEIDIYYRGRLIAKHFLDLVVENSVILELKTVESLSKAHYAQVRSYQQASGIFTAILVNFGDDKVDFRRINRSRKDCLHPPHFPRVPIPDPTDAEKAGETSATRINTRQ